MKHGLSLLTMLLCAAMAQAEVLVQEDFNYPLGDDLTGHGWYTQYGEPSGITLTNGLEFTGYIGFGVGNYIGHFNKAEDAMLPAGMYIYKTQSGTHKVIR